MNESLASSSQSKFASLSFDSPVSRQRHEILSGLTADRPSIDPKYLYDQSGSELFDAICDLPEYYPTRTEQKIMDQNMVDVAATFDGTDVLVEYGSGSSSKTRSLLRAIDPSIKYMPVDISADHLYATADDLRIEFHNRAIVPVVADFTKPFELTIASTDDHRSLVSAIEQADEKATIYFPGSTIGNLTKSCSRDLLIQMRRQAGDEGGLLIGIDLQKDVDVLLAAYDDSEGVTAKFNQNVLTHLNRLIGSQFDTRAFEHDVSYNSNEHRIEIFLRCTSPQQFCVDGQELRFQVGDRIHTEYSHKYTIDGFVEMAGHCGWSLSHNWTDPKHYFAVLRFDANDSIVAFSS